MANAEDRCGARQRLGGCVPRRRTPSLGGDVHAPSLGGLVAGSRATCPGARVSGQAAEKPSCQSRAGDPLTSGTGWLEGGAGWWAALARGDRPGSPLSSFAALSLGTGVARASPQRRCQPSPLLRGHLQSLKKKSVCRKLNPQQQGLCSTHALGRGGG